MTGRALLALLAVVPWPLAAGARKLTFEERIEITRGLMAEYATVKSFLPRSKKPLLFPSNGNYDRKAWDAVGKEHGPAARLGDQVQITKVDLEDDKIVLEINGGMKGRKWYQRVEVGMGNRTSPVSGDGTPTAGTTIALVFTEGVPALPAAEVKKLLAPVLDFEKRSVTEQYTETLPAPIRQAIKQNRALEGMDREQVLLALGRPRHKTRETKEGMELEDWIYGNPPGKITFVTFHGSKVIRVKETYAGLGGSTAPPPAQP